MDTSTASLLASMVQHHRGLALDSNVDAAAQATDDTPSALAYAAARRLGFIDSDAQTIAHAWQRQSERLGHFDPLLWPTELTDFDVPETQHAPFAPCPHDLGLYAVLPSAEWVGRMARAGVPTVQLRYKSPDQTAIQQEIAAAVAAVQGTGSRLFINDHWREAIAAGAYGVHVGQEDLDTLSSDDLAQIQAAGLRLGLSTHGYAEMLRAHAVRPSYLALGAVFPTTLKAMATPPQGTGRLHAYARLMHKQPLVAIGGISSDDLPTIASSGVGSFAVVRAITAAADPEASAQTLMARWETLQCSEQNL